MTPAAAEDSDYDIHVVPLRDLRPHALSCACWCRPAPDTEEANIWVHHALDPREQHLSGERPLQ